MKRLMAVVGCLAVVVACSDDATIGDERDTLEGSGTIITESRSVTGFDGIEVVGSGDVVVAVTGTDSLQISADDNIMPLLTSDVRGGTLELGIEPGNPISPSREVRYDVTVADISAITILGAADFDVTGIDADSFVVDIAGSGEVTLSGSGGRLAVDIKGAGNVDAEGLEAQQATVDIAGSGNVVVNASDELDVSIGGTGNVEYLGNPTVNQSVGGVGEVTARSP